MLSLRARLFAIMLALLFSFASIRAEEIPEGIMPRDKRQAAGTGVTSSTPAQQSSTTPQQQSSTTPQQQSSNTPQQQSSNTPAPASSTAGNNGGTTSNTANNTPASTSVDTVIPVTTTNADGSTITSQLTTKTLAPVSESAVQTKAGSKNSVVKVGTKTIDPATLTHKTTVKQPLVTKETRHQTYTSVWTSNGHVYSSVYTTENVFQSTTGFATATINPSLANAGGDGSNLSSNTKAIIGGVVGGIGGAILIGGLAFVAWRLWGKKKQQQEGMHEDLHSSSDSQSWQKRYSGNTLETEQYHNPNGPVNTASNF